MGNILARVVTRPDKNLNARLDATVKTLGEKQAIFEAHTKNISLLLTSLEEQVAKDLELRQKMMELLVSARALKKRVRRLEAAVKREKRRQDILKMKAAKRTGVRPGVPTTRGKNMKGKGNVRGRPRPRVTKD